MNDPRNKVDRSGIINTETKDKPQAPREERVALENFTKMSMREIANLKCLDYCARDLHSPAPELRENQRECIRNCYKKINAVFLTVASVY